MNSNRNADTANVIIYFASKDTHYSITDGVMKPISHSAALKAIAHTDVQLTSGNMTTIVTSAVQQ